MNNRKQRKEEAKLNKQSFEPKYNGRVITKAEYDKEVSDLQEKLKKKSETKEDSTK